MQFSFLFFNNIILYWTKGRVISLLIFAEQEVLELPFGWLTLLIEIAHYVFQTELITATFRSLVALILAPITRF